MYHWKSGWWRWCIQLRRTYWFAPVRSRRPVTSLFRWDLSSFFDDVSYSSTSPISLRRSSGDSKHTLPSLSPPLSLSLSNFSELDNHHCLTYRLRYNIILERESESLFSFREREVIFFFFFGLTRCSYETYGIAFPQSLSDTKSLFLYHYYIFYFLH